MEPLPKENEVHGDDVGGSIDRLSNLPDEILHYILLLSGFQIFDVVELGVLSKRWNNLWVTMPYLDIDLDIDIELVDCTLVEKFRSFINWMLTRQGESRLVRFRLSSRELFDEVQILRWLRVVAERNVQELDIQFVPAWGFSLPLFIAVNDSLIVLKLTPGNEVMRLPSVRLNQLQTLELNAIEFTHSDMLQQLFSGCCLLENSRLNDCVPKSFNIWDFSSSHLKELISNFNDTCTLEFSYLEIKVSCPNLILFKYSAPATINYILENVFSLETLWVQLFGIKFQAEPQVGGMILRNLKEVHHINDLNLNWEVVDCLCYVIDELIHYPPFPNLKSLRLYMDTVNKHTHIMILLLDHCPNVEVLNLISDEFRVEEWDNEQWELQCETIVSWKSHPHLKTIELVDFRGDGYELDFLIFLLKHAKTLEKLDIIRMRGSDISLEIIEKVSMFSKAYSGIVVTFLDPYHK